MPESPHNPPPLHFRARHRLTHALEFQRAFHEGVKRYRGPIAIFAVPNSRQEPRLGLSISGRVGSAVVRNHLKRLIREAFRLDQHELPRLPDGTRYDYVVTCRPHEHLPLSAYRKTLLDLANDAHRLSQRAPRPGPAEDRGSA